MSLVEFQQAWKAESSQVKVAFDADRLEREVRKSREVFRGAIFWRDVREVGVALAMVPLWIAMGIGMALPWTWYLTVPVLLWIAGFMMVDRLRHPQHPSEPGQSLLFYLEESLAQVEHQIWLLQNVFWWYLLPPSISIAVFLVHTGWEETGSWWGAILMTTLPGALVCVVYYGIYRLNRMTVQKQLVPRRDELLDLIWNLEGEE
ncbi:MAG: hypothetical protein KDB14_28900 [Planctomycetales bacterium]|nr:hypothetical protein [Planctomycetales bacterium]